MIVTRIDPFTREEHSYDIPVEQEDIEYYKNSEVSIHDLFPDLTYAERLFIATGVYDDVWDNLCDEGRDD